MLRILALAAASVVATPCHSQITDCNALAKDNILKKEVLHRTDNSKLIFLARLTQMDEKSSGEALAHAGRVEVGPIKIGPGTWNKDKQDRLRKDLENFVSIDQLLNTASTSLISSGDEIVAKTISDCIERQGGLNLKLKPSGSKTVIAELMWIPFPGGGSASIEDVTAVNAKITGGHSYTKKGAKLGDRSTRIITLSRTGNDDLTLVVNTSMGAKSGYLPPSILPPAPPAGQVRRSVDSATPVLITSGGGGRGPYCQWRESTESCVTPQHAAGKLIPGSGRAIVEVGNGAQNTHWGWHATQDSPERYCVKFWANTTACQTQVSGGGRATATEVYPDD